MVTGLPSNGSTEDGRLRNEFTGGFWVFNDCTYSAANPVRAAITSPAAGSTLSGSPVTFAWSAGSGATQYWLIAGTTLGGYDLYTASQGSNLTGMVTGLPSNG